MTTTLHDAVRRLILDTSLTPAWPCQELVDPLVERIIAVVQARTPREDLVILNQADIAARCRRSITTVASWVTRGSHGMPVPDGRHEGSGRPFWFVTTIDPWIRAHPELTRESWEGEELDD